MGIVGQSWPEPRLPAARVGRVFKASLFEGGFKKKYFPGNGADSPGKCFLADNNLNVITLTAVSLK
jgi:hypothetical protein